MTILIHTDCDQDLNVAFGVICNSLTKDSSFLINKHTIKIDYRAMVIDDHIKIIFYSGNVDKISEMDFDYFCACSIEACSFFSEKGITELHLLNDVIMKVKEYM